MVCDAIAVKCSSVEDQARPAVSLCLAKDGTAETEGKLTEWDQDNINDGIAYWDIDPDELQIRNDWGIKGSVGKAWQSTMLAYLKQDQTECDTRAREIGNTDAKGSEACSPGNPLGLCHILRLLTTPFEYSAVLLTIYYRSQLCKIGAQSVCPQGLNLLPQSWLVCADWSFEQLPK